MLRQLAQFVVRYRTGVIAGWLVLAATMAIFAPSLSEVGTADETSFLPTDADSIRAREVIDQQFPGEAAATTSLVVFHRPDGLTESDYQYAEATAVWLTSPEAPAEVEGVVSPFTQPEQRQALISPDETTLLLPINFNVEAFQTSANEAVTSIRDHVAAEAPTGLDVAVTGEAAIGTDLLASIIDAVDSTTIITVILVIVLLLLIYRSPVAALVPLITITVAFLVSRGTLGLLADAGWEISSLLDSFIVVLVFGVGTDYALFFISRFREELARNDVGPALITTVERIGAVIVASAATVIIGLASLAVARFGLIQTMGPALAITIVITLITGLTLTPALLSLVGHRLFWPAHRAVQAAGPSGGFWARLAETITRRPGIAAVAIVVVLALPYPYLPQLDRSFDLLAELPTSSEARQGFDTISERFDAGTFLPVTIVVQSPATDLASPQGQLEIARLTDLVQEVPGVRVVRSLTDPTGTGAAPAAEASEAQAAQVAALYLSEDRSTTRLTVLLDGDPYAPEAFTTIQELRDLMATAVQDSAAGPLEVHVGGASAEFADIQTVMNEDFQVVMLVTTIGVFLVMALLLRSLVAPLYLIATVLLSYGSSLALVTWILQDLLGQPGVNYLIPLITLVLLVALGADYNIFLMHRIREESATSGVRVGVRRASAATGAIITSAGIILAGTFAALMSAPLQMLFQVGLAVAVGILLDTFVVRGMLVPALAAVVGNWNWWPGSREPQSSLETAAPQGQPQAGGDL